MCPIKSLAHPTQAKAGPCAICGRPAASWHRTGLAAGGLVRAALACEDHESDVVHGLHELTLDDVVRLTPARRRITCAVAAERRADRLDARAAELGRRAAELRGSSSHTHTASLLSGDAARQASALREYAAALRTAVAATPKRH